MSHDPDDDGESMQPCAGCDSTISTTSGGGWAHDEPGHSDHEPRPIVRRVDDEDARYDREVEERQRRDEQEADTGGEGDGE